MPIWNKIKEGLKDVAPEPPKHYTEILLSYDEYIDCWTELETSIHQKACDTIAAKGAFPTVSEKAAAFSADVMLCVAILATRAWRERSRIPEKLLYKVEYSISHSAFVQFAGSNDELAESLQASYSSLDEALRDSFPISQVEKEEDVYKRCAVMAHYCFEHGEQEQRGEELEQALAVVFVEGDTVFKRLSLTSIPDGNTIAFPKPHFIVQKD